MWSCDLCGELCRKRTGAARCSARWRVRCRSTWRSWWWRRIGSATSAHRRWGGCWTLSPSQVTSITFIISRTRSDCRQPVCHFLLILLVHSIIFTLKKNIFIIIIIIMQFLTPPAPIQAVCYEPIRSALTGTAWRRGSIWRSSGPTGRPGSSCTWRRPMESLTTPRSRPSMRGQRSPSLHRCKTTLRQLISVSSLPQSV